MRAGTVAAVMVLSVLVMLLFPACDVSEVDTCEAGIGLAFLDQPVWVRDRFNAISWRESRNQPAARNPNSSAVGCLQILTRLHADRIARLGYTAADMTRPLPNAQVARSLFDEAGFTPWAAA